MKIETKEQFKEFVGDLLNNLLLRPQDFENKKLADFLEALGSYTEDIQGYYDNTEQTIDSEKASWQVFADLLKGASIYE
jgi:hypothetical protein